MGSDSKMGRLKRMEADGHGDGTWGEDGQGGGGEGTEACHLCHLGDVGG